MLHIVKTKVNGNTAISAVLPLFPLPCHSLIWLTDYWQFHKYIGNETFDADSTFSALGLNYKLAHHTVTRI